MGTRFRRSFKVAPGVRVNLNKKSASISFGPKGLKHTVSTTGKSHTTVGIPGTGLSYTTSSGGKSGAQQGAVSIPAAQRPTSPKSKTVALLLCIFLGFFGVHRFYVGNKILLSPSRLIPLRSAQNPHNCWVFETIYHPSCVLLGRPLHSKSCIKIVVVCRRIFL